MFIWIHCSLGLPLIEQVAVRHLVKLFGLLWWLVSYYTMMIWERVVRFCHILFIVATLHGIYVTLSLVLFVDMVRSWLDNQDASLNGFFLFNSLCEYISRPVHVETPFRSELDHLSGEILAERMVS